MAIIARTTQRRVLDIPQNVGSQELRTRDTSAAFGAIGATLATEIGQDMQAIARKEVLALEERDRVRMMAEKSEFEIEAIQRVNVLEVEGTGEKPFVKGVMEDAAERVKEFIARQPEFLKAEAALYLLPIQTQIAKSAIAIQQIRIDNENRKNAETFRNATVNQVRYGQVSESVALAKADSFADKLPDTIRDGERAKARAEIRTASLKFTMQNDPVKALSEIEKGNYNDIDSNDLDSIYASGIRTLEANRNRVVLLENKAQKLVGTDPAQAGLLSLEAKGITNPTRVQLLDAQRKLGIPEADRSLITKEKAQALSRQLSAVQNVDEFILVREEIRVKAEEEGRDASELIEDISKLANVPMALRVVFDVSQVDVSEEFLSGAIDVLRNPKAGDNARKQIKEGITKGAWGNIITGRGPDALTKIENLTLESVADEVEVMAKSGVSVRVGEGGVGEFTQTILDISAIIFNNHRLVGENGQAAVESMLTERKSNSEIRVEGADGYMLPLGLAAAVSEEDMNNLAKAFIRDKLTVPTKGKTFPSKEFARVSMERNAGWTMYGNKALILRAYGMPVFRKDEDGRETPAIITFDQLLVRKKPRTGVEEPITPSVKRVVPPIFRGR